MNKRLWWSVVVVGLASVVVYAAASYPSAVKSFTTKLDGQTISAAHVNDIQDEVVAVEDGLLNGLAHILKPGTNNTYDLGTSSLKWKDAYVAGTLNPKCRAVAYHNTTQSVNDSTAAPLSLNSEDVDTATMHDLVTNNSRITIATGCDGFYRVTAGTTFAADADGYREIAVRKNGTTLMVDAFRVPFAVVGTYEQITWSGDLVATDYVELYIVHTAGAALNIGSATRAQSSTLQAVRVW